MLNEPAVHDVIVIGGSYAGLAAALQLARARRRVLVIDAGQRRNRFAEHSHGFLGQDGQPPGVIAARGREELLAYPTVTWREAEASHARRIPGGFSVRVGAEEEQSKRLVLATGVVDEVPKIPGIAERWGKSVFLCPYCDGYERQMGRLGVLATGPSSTRFAVIVSEWAGQMTLFANNVSLDPEHLPILTARGARVEPEPVVGLEDHGSGIQIRLRDGRAEALDALFLLPRTRFGTPLPEQLGCEVEMGPLGPMIQTDVTGETSVPGLFACGDVALPRSFVAYAVADGVRAGTGAHQSLLFRI